jgi:SAM-dependent methyltransferase
VLISVTTQDNVAAIRQLAGLATPMALRVAVTLGLPDRLREPATADDLATELAVSAVGLELLLSHLTTLSILERTDDGFRTTDFGETLCTDADNGLTNFLHLDMAGGRSEMAFVELRHSVTTGEAGYTRHFGADFWTDLDRNRDLREQFDRQMVHRFRQTMPPILANYDWGRFASIVDVGGGNGTVLAAILDAHPAMTGTVVELEPTAAAANRRFAERGLGGRAEAVAGSFFDPLPAGAQAYLLADILHDWDDDHAHRILGRVAEAVAPDGRVLILEAVRGRKSTTAFDLAMFVIFAGRERRVEEFETLAAAHGLALVAVTDVSEERCLLEFRRVS